MTLYSQARRHVGFMVVNVFVGALFVGVVDRFLGHSAIAFAIVIGILFVLNMRIWRFNCPRCGSNLFIRKNIPLPWPNRHCSQCALDLDSTPPEQ